MMDWKALVGTVAPGIATALGGPLAGLAVSALTNALGLPSGSTEDDVAATMKTATPDQLLALKKADQDFAVRMEELGIDLEKVNAADRDSARRMQTETRSRMPAFIALMSLAGFFGILLCMIFVTLPATAEAPLNIMLGVLGTLVVGISNFFYGSSSGSARKTEMLHRRD
jgi:hypothetical protein